MLGSRQLLRQSCFAGLVSFNSPLVSGSITDPRLIMVPVSSILRQDISGDIWGHLKSGDRTPIFLLPGAASALWFSFTRIFRFEVTFVAPATGRVVYFVVQMRFGCFPLFV